MVYVSTHAGKRHSISEDSVLVGTQVLYETNETVPVPDIGFICVADGVGGNRGGAQASRFVLNALSAWLDSPSEDLENYIRKINDDLIASSSENEAISGMATTLTGFFTENGYFKLVHVGNTRAYIRQGKYLKQITSDHTTYNWLISSGLFEAAEKCNRSEITNCFGGNNPALLSKLHLADCQQFTIALLTSDGIHEYVDLDTLEEIIERTGSYQEKCEEIIKRAIEAGSEDDMSVVIICLNENI